MAFKIAFRRFLTALVKKYLKTQFTKILKGKENNMVDIFSISVLLDQTELVLKRGESATLTATVLPASLANKNVIWSSNDTSIATVDNGRVLGLKEGVTNVIAISAFDNTVAASCKVIVSNDILVSSIEINPATTMYPGNTANFTVSVFPLDATNKSVLWSSDDPSVASVDPQSGFVTALKQGTTMIRATAQDIGGVSACYELTVEYPYPAYISDGVKTYSYALDGNTSLSKNFKVEEFQCKDGSDEILIDMQLVRYLQQIRDWAGGSITINSGYRTPSWNAHPKVQGAPNSMHLYGKAADIVCSTKTPLELAKKAELLEAPGIEWNDVGKYTHIDTRAVKYYFKRVPVKNEEGKEVGKNITVDTFQDLS